MRPGADGETVEVFFAASEEEVVNFQEIFAIGGWGEIEQAAMTVAFKFFPSGAI